MRFWLTSRPVLDSETAVGVLTVVVKGPTRPCVSP